MKSKNPKQYWKMLADNNKDKGVSQEQLTNFYQHFKSLADSDPTGDQSVPLTIQDNIAFDTRALNSDFTEREVSDGITNLKSGKAAGSDQILNEHIKSTANIFFTSMSNSLIKY